MSLRAQAARAGVAAPSARLDGVLRIGHDHRAMKRSTAPVGVIHSDDTFTVTLQVKCAVQGAQRLVVDQSVVNRAKAGLEQPDIIMGTGPLYLDHQRLDSMKLAFVSGTVSEGGKSYELRLTQHALGTTVYKVELKLPTTGTWIPITMRAGEKITTFTLTYQPRPFNHDLSTIHSDDAFTVALQVKCAVQGAQSLVVDQSVVDRAKAGLQQPVITVGPGPLWLDHKRLNFMELEFVSGTMSEDGKSYELRIMQDMFLRDGTTIYKVEYKPSIRWDRLKMQVGEKTTTFTLVYKARRSTQDDLSTR